MTLILYCVMGLYALVNCIFSKTPDTVPVIFVIVFWSVTFLVFFHLKKKEIYGLTMLLAVAVLGFVIKSATGSIFEIVAVFIVQWIGGIFFMEESTVPGTFIVQELALLAMLFYPLGTKPTAGSVLDFLISTVFIAVSAISCKKLVSMLNSEIEQNQRNADERSRLLVEIQKQYSDIQDALNAKSEFLAAMSHEIRTPINTIIGMDEVALRECKQAELQAPLHNIAMASANLLTIINDVLDFSKIEAGRMEIVAKPYELREILNNIARMHSLRAEEKGLVFHIAVDPETPANLIGDESRISQVFSNLVSNAIKYTDKGEVQVHVFAKRTDNDLAVLNISVKDTGIGIRQEDMDQLFQTFTRLDMKRNCSVEGTGLGLSLVQKVVKAMHGEIQVTSEYGKGSVFTVWFPQKILNGESIGDYSSDSLKETYQKDSYKNTFTAPNAKILVVDDNQMNLAVAASLLKYTEIQVTRCLSGSDCLKAAKENHYDIIFLDHMMPEMDGVETLKQLRLTEENKCRNTPVIALTANAIAGARETYIAAGFDDYLSKPIIYKDFESMILRYLPPELIETSDSDPAGNSQENAVTAELAPSTGACPEKLIDEKIGIEYSGNDVKLYYAILEMFVTEAGEAVLKLENARSNADWPAYQREAHSLKSNSKGIGALELSETAKKLEQYAKEGDADSIAAHHPELVSLCRKVLTEASSMLAK